MFDLGLRHSTAIPRDIHAPRDACVVGLRVTSSFHWGYHACSSRIFNITSSPLFRTKSTHHATSTRQGTPAWIFGRSESISLLVFMKNFHQADSNEVMAVRIILASQAHKRLNPHSTHDVRRVHEKFLSRRFELGNGCQTNFGLSSPKTLDSFFQEMTYV